VVGAAGAVVGTTAAHPDLPVAGQGRPLLPRHTHVPGWPVSRLRALAALGPRRWPFVARVALTAALVELGVRTLPLPTVTRLAGVRPASGPGRPGDAWPLLTARERDRCRLALRVVAAPPFSATCLRRSLLLGHLLRRRRPTLQVGVAKDAGRVAAHAWIEIDGLSLDAESVGYVPLPPAAASRAGKFAA